MILDKWIISAIFLFFTIVVGAQSEREYEEHIATLIGGETEVSVVRGRVDIVTDDYAIEVEKASRWKESIGQCLWYALQTNKKAGIILLVFDEDDYLYGQMLNTTLMYAELTDKISVWYYPEDFPNAKLKP